MDASPDDVDSGLWIEPGVWRPRLLPLQYYFARPTLVPRPGPLAPHEIDSRGKRRHVIPAGMKLKHLAPADVQQACGLGLEV